MAKFTLNQSNAANNSSLDGGRGHRIGELLIAAKIIKPEVLNTSLQIARTSKTLIGRTLISVGHLDEQKLQAALDIQALIRNRSVSAQFGIDALNIACTSRISANDALQKLGWRVDEKSNTQKSSFMQFMIDAGLISAEVLVVAEKQSKENNLPLSRCLLINRYVTQSGLEAVLVAQTLIRDKELTKEEALAALKLSLENKEPLERSLIQFGIEQLGESDKRVLDMLSMAGFITETDKLTILERSLTEERSCIKVLAETRMVAADLIDKALILQVQILAGNLTLGRAVDLLEQSQTKGIDWQGQIHQLQVRNKTAVQIEQLLDLLKGSGLLLAETITNASELAKNSHKNLGDILLSQQEIQALHIEDAWQAQRMIDDKIISFEYACTVLRKLSGKSQPNVQENSEQSLSKISAVEESRGENWLSKLTKKLFNK